MEYIKDYQVLIGLVLVAVAIFLLGMEIDHLRTTLSWSFRNLDT